MNRTNILLAEDDADDYHFFVEAFKSISPFYNIIGVRNGLECLSFLKTSFKPEIIFLDLNIPLKNGLECLKRIKDNEVFCKVPVVIYSTSHYIKHIDAAFKGGAHYYIVNPGNADILVEVLTTVLERLSVNLNRPGKEAFVIRAFATF